MDKEDTCNCTRNNYHATIGTHYLIGVINFYLLYLLFVDQLIYTLFKLLPLACGNDNYNNGQRYNNAFAAGRFSRDASLDSEKDAGRIINHVISKF